MARLLVRKGDSGDSGGESDKTREAFSISVLNGRVEAPLSVITGFNRHLEQKKKNAPKTNGYHTAREYFFYLRSQP